MTNGVTRLKELLLDDHRVALDRMNRQVASVAARLEEVEALLRKAQDTRQEILRRTDDVFERVGTDERFQRSVADVLDRALRDAEVKHHDQMARAVAPLVVGTIKTELRNSQDEMVEALYPITGQLVKRYVANAMKELAENINRRLENNPVSLRLRSLATGRPVSELAMAATQDLEIEEILLIRRGSGELLARWPESKDLSNRDIHVSGVLAAINDFASQTFQADGGAVRSFEADDFEILLRASPLYLVAAKCRGTASATVQRVFDEEFITFLKSDAMRSAATQTAQAPARAVQELGALATSVGGRVETLAPERPASGGGALKLLALIIGVPLLALLGWWLFTEAERSYVHGIASGTLANQAVIKGYPLNHQTGYRGRTVTLTGLVPDGNARSQVIGALRSALPRWSEVNTDNLQALPARQAVAAPAAPPAQIDTSAFEQRVAQMQRTFDLARMRQSLSRATERLLATGRALQSVRRALDGPREPPLLRAVSSDEVADASGTVEKLRLRLTTVRARLRNADINNAGLDRIGADIDRMRVELGRVEAQMEAALGRTNTTQQTQPQPADPVPARPDANADESAASTRATAAADNMAVVANRIAAQAETLEQLGRINLPEVQRAPAASRPAEPTPRARLIAWTSSHAIFFSDGTNFRSAQAAQGRLDELARLIQASGDLVRVVGYTDERGRSQRNSTLALRRAETVLNALLTRGVPANQLVALGRADARELSPEDGRNSPNRRVEFEVGFVGEADINPAVQDRPTDR